MKPQSNIEIIPENIKKSSKVDFSTDEATGSENILDNMINPIPNIRINELAIPFWFAHGKPLSNQVSPKNIFSAYEIYTKSSINNTHHHNHHLTPEVIITSNDCHDHDHANKHGNSHANNNNHHPIHNHGNNHDPNHSHSHSLSHVNDTNHTHSHGYGLSHINDSNHTHSHGNSNNHVHEPSHSHAYDPSNSHILSHVNEPSHIHSNWNSYGYDHCPSHTHVNNNDMELSDKILPPMIFNTNNNSKKDMITATSSSNSSCNRNRSSNSTNTKQQQQQQQQASDNFDIYYITNYFSNKSHDHHSNLNTNPYASNTNFHDDNANYNSNTNNASKPYCEESSLSNLVNDNFKSIIAHGGYHLHKNSISLPQSPKHEIYHSILTERDNNIANSNNKQCNMQQSIMKSKCNTDRELQQQQQQLQQQHLQLSSNVNDNNNSMLFESKLKTPIKHFKRTSIVYPNTDKNPADSNTTIIQDSIIIPKYKKSQAYDVDSFPMNLMNTPHISSSNSNNNTQTSTLYNNNKGNTNNTFYNKKVITREHKKSAQFNKNSTNKMIQIINNRYNDENMLHFENENLHNEANNSNFKSLSPTKNILNSHNKGNQSKNDRSIMPLNSTMILDLDLKAINLKKHNINEQSIENHHHHHHHVLSARDHYANRDKPDLNVISIADLIKSSNFNSRILQEKTTLKDHQSQPQHQQHQHHLHHIQIFTKISLFLNLEGICSMTKVSRKFRSAPFMSIIKKRLTNLIIKGLNANDQYLYWDHFVNFGYLKTRYSLQYSMNSLKPSTFQRDILSDLDRTRTFTNPILANQKTLYKILLALSNSVPKIGYVQGFNSIVAIFLAHNILNDVEIYWLMNYALKKCKLEEMYIEGFPRVQILNYQLEIFMRNYLPDIVDHLGERGINLSYFTTQWFITMFSYELDLNDLTKIWNLYFLKSWKILIRVALGLLSVFKDSILLETNDDLPAYLKNFVRDNLEKINEQNLLVISHQYKVTNRLLKTLETLYEHSAPCHVLLTFNHLKKPEWKILPDDFEFSMENLLKNQIDVMEYLNMDLYKSTGSHNTKHKDNMQIKKTNQSSLKYQNIHQNHDNHINNNNNNNNALDDEPLYSKSSRKPLKFDIEKANENFVYQDEMLLFTGNLNVESMNGNQHEYSSQKSNKEKPISLLNTLSQFGKKLKGFLRTSQAIKDNNNQNENGYLLGQTNLAEKKSLLSSTDNLAYRSLLAYSNNKNNNNNEQLSTFACANSGLSGVNSANANSGINSYGGGSSSSNHMNNNGALSDRVINQDIKRNPKKAYSHLLVTNAQYDAKHHHHGRHITNKGQNQHNAYNNESNFPVFKRSVINMIKNTNDASILSTFSPISLSASSISNRNHHILQERVINTNNNITSSDNNVNRTPENPKITNNNSNNNNNNNKIVNGNTNDILVSSSSRTKLTTTVHSTSNHKNKNAKAHNKKSSDHNITKSDKVKIPKLNLDASQENINHPKIDYYLNYNPLKSSNNHTNNNNINNTSDRLIADDSYQLHHKTTHYTKTRNHNENSFNNKSPQLLNNTKFSKTFTLYDQSQSKPIKCYDNDDDKANIPSQEHAKFYKLPSKIVANENDDQNFMSLKDNTTKDNCIKENLDFREHPIMIENENNHIIPILKTSPKFMLQAEHHHEYYTNPCPNLNQGYTPLHQNYYHASQYESKFGNTNTTTIIAGNHANGARGEAGHHANGAREGASYNATRGGESAGHYASGEGEAASHYTSRGGGEAVSHHTSRGAEEGVVSYYTSGGGGAGNHISGGRGGGGGANQFQLPIKINMIESLNLSLSGKNRHNIPYIPNPMSTPVTPSYKPNPNISKYNFFNGNNNHDSYNSMNLGSNSANNRNPDTSRPYNQQFDWVHFDSTGCNIAHQDKDYQEYYG